MNEQLALDGIDEKWVREMRNKISVEYWNFCNTVYAGRPVGQERDAIWQHIYDVFPNCGPYIDAYRAYMRRVTAGGHIANDSDREPITRGVDFSIREDGLWTVSDLRGAKMRELRQKMAALEAELAKLEQQ